MLTSTSISAVFLLVLLLFIQSVAPEERFVSSSTGSDERNNCAVASAPCATIQHAVEMSASNDTIRLFEGVHVINNPIIISHSIAILPYDQKAELGSVVVTAGSHVPPFLFSIDYNQIRNDTQLQRLVFSLDGPLFVRDVHTVLSAIAAKQDKVSVTLALNNLLVQNMTGQLVDARMSRIYADVLNVSNVVVQDCALSSAAGEWIAGKNDAVVKADQFQHIHVTNMTFSRIRTSDDIGFVPNLLEFLGTAYCDGITVRDSTVSPLYFMVYQRADLKNIKFYGNRIDHSLITFQQRQNDPEAHVYVENLSMQNCTGQPSTAIRVLEISVFTLRGIEANNLHSFYNIFYLDKTAATIENGVIDGSQSTTGCIEATDSHVWLSQLLISNCRTSSIGGAVRVFSGRLQVSDSGFQNNSAELGGGALAVVYPLARFSSGISFCSFSENYSQGGQGGAILVIGQYTALQARLPPVRFKDTAFVGNHAGKHGGSVSVTSVELQLNGIQFFKNYATTGHGGALFCDGDGKIVMDANVGDRQMFLNNNVALSGGAIAIQRCSLSVLKDSRQRTFENNIATKYGGALYIAGLTGVEGTSGMLVCKANTAGIAGGCVFTGQESSVDDTHSVNRLLQDGGNNNANQYGSWMASWPVKLLIRSAQKAEAIRVPPMPFQYSIFVEVKDMFGSTISDIPLVASLTVSGFQCQEPALNVLIGIDKITRIPALDVRRCPPGQDLSLQVLVASDDTGSVSLNASIPLYVENCPFGYTVYGSLTFECMRVLELVIGVLVAISLVLALMTLLFVAIVFACVQFIKRRKRDELVRRLLGDEDAFERLQDISAEDGDDVPRWLHGLRAKGLVINSSDVRIRDLLASGGSASVFSAEYGGTPVALKMFPTKTILGDQNTDISSLESELVILQKIRHPCIIQMLGVVCFGNKLALCLELMQDSLAALITVSVVTNQSGNSLCIGWPLKRRILQQVASGMAFLHSKHIGHRDLKLENVLFQGVDIGDLDKTMSRLTQVVVKIADFGQSKSFFGTNMQHTLMRGTAAYASPESLGSPCYGTAKPKAPNNSNSLQSDDVTSLLPNSSYELSCDVYSFGILVFCLLTETTRPYNELSDTDIMLQVRRGLRPSVDDTAFLRALQQQTNREISNGSLSRSQQSTAILQARAVLQLMRECWDADPAKRPTFAEIVTRLNSQLIN